MSFRCAILVQSERGLTGSPYAQTAILDRWKFKSMVRKFTETSGSLPKAICIPSRSRIQGSILSKHPDQRIRFSLCSAQIAIVTSLLKTMIVGQGFYRGFRVLLQSASISSESGISAQLRQGLMESGCEEPDVKQLANLPDIQKQDHRKAIVFLILLR